MGTNWLAVDTNFPTFTGAESSDDKISAMLNYMFILKEQLQYSMRNLSLDNFNAAGLDKLTDEASKKLGEQISLFQNQLNQLNGTVNALSAQISEAVQMGTRMENAENEITYLQDFSEEADERLTDLEEQVQTAVAGGITLTIGGVEPEKGPAIWMNTTQEEREA